MSTEVTVGKTRLVAVRGDITREEVDVVVNAANSSLMGGGGVDGAIHRVGGPAILDECKRIVSSMGRLPAGKAVITTGGNLPAGYVIHTVGPVWRGGDYAEAETLASCYTESLKIATDLGLQSIAFPAISTGIYGYPQEKAAAVAIRAVSEYAQSNPTCLTTILFILFDDRSFDIYAAALGGLESSGRGHQ